MLLRKTLYCIVVGVVEAADNWDDYVVVVVGVVEIVVVVVHVEESCHYKNLHSHHQYSYYLLYVSLKLLLNLLAGGIDD